MRERAFLAVLVAATLAGTSGVFIKNIHIPATSMSFIRTFVPTFLMAIMMVARGVPFFRGNYPIMLVGSVLNALRMYLFFTAYIYTSIGNAVLISYTWPIFVAIIGSMYLGEKISRWNMAAMSLAFLGIMVVYANKPFSFGDRDFIGMSAALGTAVVYASSVVVFKKEAAYYKRMEIIFYQNLVGILIFLPFIITNEPLPNSSDITLAVTHATLLGTMGFFMFFYGLKHLKAATASALSYIEIVSATLLGVFVMGEKLTWNMFLGGAMIIMATVLIRKE